MKNICIVSECQQVLGVGGTETVSYLLKNELIKNGYHVWSMYFIPKASKTEIDIEFPEKQDICSNENIRTLIDAIKKHKIDIIISQGAPFKGLLELCIEAKRANKCKLVYCYHFNPLKANREFNDYKERYLLNRSFILKPLYSLYFEFKRHFFIKRDIKFFKEIEIAEVDAFISLNKDFTNFLRGLYPNEFKERFHTIPNPIVLDDNELISEKGNIILFVGRLTYQKRLDRLLNIWKKMHHTFKNWKIVVVGDGEYANEYQRITEKLQLKNVDFVGQKASEEYFKKSKIICMTSSHESFGMVLLEGQKYGCIPIAYNSFESASDIIRHGYNGILITPFNEQEYINGLKTLIMDESIRESLANNSKDSVKKFDAKIIVKKWIHLLETL